MKRDRTSRLESLAAGLRDKYVRAHDPDADPDVAAWFHGHRPQIAHALQRLADGQYGVCVDCERDIPLVRLEAQPEATRCVQCQSRHERSEVRPGIGYRVSLAS